MIKKILVLLTLTLFIHGYSHADDHMTPNSFAVTLKVPEVDVAKVEALLQSHHQFMHDKHSLSGENRLNSYSIVKGYEVVDMTDPSKGLTGNVFYFLSEHYETPMGFKCTVKLVKIGRIFQNFRQLCINIKLLLHSQVKLLQR